MRKLPPEFRLQQAQMSAMQLRKPTGARTGAKNKETFEKNREMT
jgi:hypothetical protein